MEKDPETCVFKWSVHNPFLPSETKEAIFCFRSPKVTKWKAFLQRGKGRRAVNNWPVSFSLEYFPVNEADEELTLEVDVSVNFVEVGNEIPSRVHVFFSRQNSYAYIYNSSITPVHGELEIIVEILIPQRYKEVIELAPNDLESLSDDLRKLQTEHPYFDLRLQSRDPDTRFPVHSYILDARWFYFFSVLEVQPNPEDPPTVATDIPPDVLDDILTYLYTGSLKHLHLRYPGFDEYRTELFQTIDKYPLHHLYMMFDPNPKCQIRKTITHLASSAMTFRLEEARELGPYAWTHSPLPGVSVTTSLRFFDYVWGGNKNVLRPSLCYTLRFTNAMKLSARVNLEYRRKVVGCDSEMRRILYECDHEIPDNGSKEVSIPFRPTVGNPSHLLRFKRGEDRREGRHVVEHSFRFILYLSTGDQGIKASRLGTFPDDGRFSLNILSKHMSVMLRRGVGANLKADLFYGVYRPHLHILHKGMFVVRASCWQNVVYDVPDDSNISDEVTIGAIRNEGFLFFIEFLYTGTCSPIPSLELLQEIGRFAGLCELFSFQDIYALEYRRLQDVEKPPTELE